MIESLQAHILVAYGLLEFQSSSNGILELPHVVIAIAQYFMVSCCITVLTILMGLRIGRDYDVRPRETQCVFHTSMYP